MAWLTAYTPILSVAPLPLSPAPAPMPTLSVGAGLPVAIRACPTFYVPPPVGIRRRRPIIVTPPQQTAALRGSFRLEARGLYRVFNAAEYRFFRSNTAPPASTPFDTNASLPHTPVDTFSNATWYLAVELFNGVLTSGRYPLGPRNEPYLRLEISGGASKGLPAGDSAVETVRLEQRAGGVIRVIAVHVQTTPAEEDWCIAYTTNGTDPPEDSPDITQAMDPTGPQFLIYDLPAASHGTTVKVRVQTRRNDGGYIYSDGSVIVSAKADASGPSAVGGPRRWTGRIPIDLE